MGRGVGLCRISKIRVFENVNGWFLEGEGEKGS